MERSPIDAYWRDGTPIFTTEEMIEAHRADRRVGYDWVVIAEGPVEVSTVHLVIDHGFGGGPPIIFETMCFGAGLDVCWRYATEAEAQASHHDVVAHLKAGDFAQVWGL